jgi:hypothetical protein
MLTINKPISIVVDSKPNGRSSIKLALPDCLG